VSTTWRAIFGRPNLRALEGNQVGPEADSELADVDTPRVGPGSYCSPRHRMPVISRNDGLSCGVHRYDARAWRILFAASWDAVYLKKWGFKMRWVT